MRRMQTRRIWLRLTRAQVQQVNAIRRYARRERPALGTPSIPAAIAEAIDFLYRNITKREADHNEQFSERP